MEKDHKMIEYERRKKVIDRQKVSERRRKKKKTKVRKVYDNIYEGFCLERDW